VRRLAFPAVSATLAALWLAACAFDSPVVASLVAAATLTAGVCLAARRRQRHRRAVAVIAAAIGLAVAGLLAAELLLPQGGPARLVLQLVFVVVLAPIAPALYSATFEASRDDSDRSAP
jgi:hypothetical protein